MSRCTACQREVPADAYFCGFCGFRLAPISKASYRSLSQTLPPLREDAPLLLTRTKQGKPNQPSQLKVVPATVPREKPKVDRVAVSTPRPQKKTGGGQAQHSQVHLRIVKDPLPVGAKQTPEKFQAPGPRQQKASVRPDSSYEAPHPRARSTAAEAEAEGNLSKRRGVSDRRFGRYPLKVEVTYSSEHNFYSGFLVNMSSGGLFVATHDPSPIGELVELIFSVPGLESCTAICRVRWIREYDPGVPDMVPGMGLQFSQLDPQARAAIELFIRHRDTIFYDDE